jgi:hypothetical protein
MKWVEVELMVSTNAMKVKINYSFSSDGLFLHVGVCGFVLKELIAELHALIMNVLNG